MATFAICLASFQFVEFANGKRRKKQSPKCTGPNGKTLNNISSDFDKLAKEFGYKTDFYAELCKKLDKEAKENKKK